MILIENQFCQDGILKRLCDHVTVVTNVVATSIDYFVKLLAIPHILSDISLQTKSLGKSNAVTKCNCSKKKIKISVNIFQLKI